MESFKAFLQKAKIDPEKFRMAMPDEWMVLLREFEAESEISFKTRKRFLLNPLRMQFPLHEEQ